MGDLGIRCGLDKLEFLSPAPYDLAVKGLGLKRKYLTIRDIQRDIVDPKKTRWRYYNKFLKQGKKTLIRVTRITKDFFLEYAGQSNIFGTLHQIEIFKELVFQSLEETKEPFQDMHRTCYLKFDRKKECFLVNKDDPDKQRRRPDTSTSEQARGQFEEAMYYKSRTDDKNKIGQLTLYLSEANSPLAWNLYTRKSKVDRQPVIKSEFRIIGDAIRRQVGIKDRTFDGLATFFQAQTQNQFTVYRKLEKKYIKQADVNHEAVGRYLLDLQSASKITPQIQGKMDMALQGWKAAYSIDTVAFVVRWAVKHGLDYRRFIIPRKTES